MTTDEEAYLALAIVAALAFASVLFWASWRG